MKIGPARGAARQSPAQPEGKRQGEKPGDDEGGRLNPTEFAQGKGADRVAAGVTGPPGLGSRPEKWAGDRRQEAEGGSGSSPVLPGSPEHTQLDDTQVLSHGPTEV
jgi:hypothetical protein